MARDVTTGLMGAVLISFAGLAVHSDRLPGRAGMTSLTRERFPLLFWSYVLLFLLVGAGLVLYSVAKNLNVAVNFVARFDALAERLVARRLYFQAGMIWVAILFVLGGIGWVVFADLTRR